MFEFAWLLLALPAAGALINLFFGSRWATATSASLPSARWSPPSWWRWASLRSHLGAARRSAQHNRSALAVDHRRRLHVGAALLLDPLSLTMALVVTGVGSLIHIYSIELHGARRALPALLRLSSTSSSSPCSCSSSATASWACSSAGKAWGLASYLLIGFWFDRRDDSLRLLCRRGQEGLPGQPRGRLRHDRRHARHLDHAGQPHLLGCLRRPHTAR